MPYLFERNYVIRITKCTKVIIFKRIIMYFNVASENAYTRFEMSVLDLDSSVVTSIHVDYVDVQMAAQNGEE